MRANKTKKERNNKNIDEKKITGRGKNRKEKKKERGKIYFNTLSIPCSAASSLLFMLITFHMSTKGSVIFPFNRSTNSGLVDNSSNASNRCSRCSTWDSNIDDRYHLYIYIYFYNNFFFFFFVTFTLCSSCLKANAVGVDPSIIGSTKITLWDSPSDPDVICCLIPFVFLTAVSFAGWTGAFPFFLWFRGVTGALADAWPAVLWSKTLYRRMTNKSSNFSCFSSHSIKRKTHRFTIFRENVYVYRHLVVTVNTLFHFPGTVGDAVLVKMQRRASLSRSYHSL